MVHFRYEWFDSLEGTKTDQQLSEYKHLSEDAGLLTIWRLLIYKCGCDVMVAMPDLGSGAERRMGSSPFIRTK